DIDYPLVNMNPLHGGAIVHAARLGRRMRAAVSYPPSAHGPKAAARCCAAPRRTMATGRPDSVHNKRSNLPVTYAARPFRPPGGAACSFTL
ncbi:TPA: hypothetical protein ACK3Q6_007369, partial [Burkholderia cepacia]